jgi:hypothetical protein
MRLGICTPWCFREATQAAIRIAEWARAADIDVTLRASNSSPPRLHTRWDAEVQTTRPLTFTAWARSCSTVIWTRPPIREQVTWAAKNGIYTVILYLWADVSEADFPALRAAQCVLCPGTTIKHYAVERVRVRKAVCICWDVGLPFVRKDPRVQTNYQWVLLPLFDREPYRMEATIVDICGRMLYRYPDTVLTAAYHSSTLAPFATRRLAVFQQYFGDRVRLRKAMPINDRPYVFQQHDLTLWPVHLTSLGNTGLLSLSMGTPVIAFDCPPVSEFLNRMNSVVVPAEGHFDELGIPRLDPDYCQFERILYQQLDAKERLAKLQQTVLHGMDQRRTVFVDGMTSVVR